MPDWNPEEIDNVEFLPGGYSNANYRLTYRDQAFALRVAGVPQPFVDRHHEHAWYQILPPSVGPRPIVLDKNSGSMLSPWIDGVLLVDAWPALDATALLDYLIGLHAALPNPERDYDLATLVREYTGAHHEVAPMSASACCHNDLNPWNIIVSSAGWATLDWEFVGHNDPLFDLVSLHQGLALPDDELPELARSYLRRSSSAAPGEPEIDRRLQGALKNFWLREMTWAAYQISQGNARDEIVEQRETAATRLRRFSAK